MVFRLSYLFIVVILFLSITTNLLSQSKANLLEQLERNNIKATEIESNIYKIEYPWGKTAVYNYNELKPQPYTDASGNILDIDTTYIDLTTIDTSLYSNMFTLWKEVNFAGWPLYYGDENKNGQLEFYGIEGYQDSSKLVIYEIDSSKNFKLKHIYKDSIYYKYSNVATGLFDLKNIGQKNYFLVGLKNVGSTGIMEGLSFKNDTITKLPTSLDFILNDSISLLYATFGDFDKNGAVDLISSMLSGVCIAEYDSTINNMRYIYSYQPGTGNLHGFATGDFDLDGRTEIVASCINGYVSLIKNIGVHNYKYIWQTRVNTLNLYRQFITNDLDKNGKPEFWVAGFNLENGAWLVKLFAFESFNDTSYIPVKIIILKPIQSNFIWHTACFSRDIDNDGIEEIIIATNSSILMLKYNGSANENDYSVFYYNYFTFYVGWIQFLTIDNDDYKLFLATKDRFGKFITMIYKKNFNTSMYDDDRNNVKSLDINKL
ncbi:MAG: VCBS repeat-containing protein, partial [Actinobacteria bacterium]|nr:VCBS repeat-containing protein [Actinomycetota bacterium]